MLLPTDELIHSDHVSIEALRILYSSCFTCGVSWSDDHVSLDCHECGGYAMVRPCPECNGNCDSKWIRNLPLSHRSRRATWDGICTFKSILTNIDANEKLNCITATMHVATPASTPSSASSTTSDAVTVCRRQGLITSSALTVL